MNKRFLAKVTSKTLIAKDTYEMVFSFEKSSFIFIPGQYVWIILPQLNYPDDRGSRRAFSITSSISDKANISVIFRKGISGYKKTLLEYGKNQTVEIEGPFGSAFSVTGNPGEGLIMISGGVGIAPFLGILRSLPQLKHVPQISLLDFNSSKDKQILPDQLREIGQKNKILIADYIGQANIKDLIDISEIQRSTFFICGPQEMIDSVYSQLRLLNVTDDRIVFEETYPCASIAFNL